MKNLRDFTIEELTRLLCDMGEKPFRAKQIYKWLFAGVSSYEEMTDISKALRQRLAAEYSVALPTVYEVYVSKLDGTRKYLLQLEDGNIIETVVMQYEYGLSICVSSQVGCAMGCKFCASTLNGLVRSLTPGEIAGQILAAQKDVGQRISNVVMMGIGEPLHNYDNVLTFLKNANQPEGLGLGYRHITLSTCGLVPKIYDLAKEQLPITLSVSLHAPNDAVRRQTMPVAERYTMEELLAACRFYAETTGRRVTFEYALIKGVNDTEACAAELARAVRPIHGHVNLIPVNPVAERGFARPLRRHAVEFMELLKKNGVNATIRRELGSDIQASCGQLRNQALQQ